MDHYKKLEFQDLIKELTLKATAFTNNGAVFYKGVVSKTSLGRYYKVDPSLFIRESKTRLEHGNVYNLFLNNLPGWTEIPKRQNSVIMTSNLNTAKGFSIPLTSKGYSYGNIYCVLPENKAILAIAPSQDIWNSFVIGLSRIGLRGKDGTLIKFNCILNELYKSTQNKGVFDSEWITLKENLKKLAYGTLEPKVRISDEETRMLDYLKKYKKDIIGFFDEILHPSTNGIKVLCFDEDFKIGDYKNNEIWTESNCLFFEEAVLVDLKRKLPKK